MTREELNSSATASYHKWACDKTPTMSSTVPRPPLCKLSCVSSSPERDSTNPPPVLGNIQNAVNVQSSERGVKGLLRTGLCLLSYNNARGRVKHLLLGASSLCRFRWLEEDEIIAIHRAYTLHTVYGDLGIRVLQHSNGLRYPNRAGNAKS